MVETSGTPFEPFSPTETSAGLGSETSEYEVTRRKRVANSLSRTFKLFLLIVVIALAIVSTTVLDRPDQVFLLKIFLVVFLSVLPGWLYLQFISVKGTGLYDEYVLNLYRLRIDSVSNLPKPPPASLYWSLWDEAIPRNVPDEAVARNIYLHKFEAAYGKGTVPESRRKRLADDNTTLSVGRRLSQRIQVDAFSPVVLATALLCVGWTVVVQPELYRDLNLFVSQPLSGLPELPQDAIRFGFIGSYAFVLQNIVRRYFQMDLRNHAYVSTIARVLLVGALIVAIHPLWAMTGAPAEVELAFAFFLGFFPELGFRIMRERLSSVVRTDDTSTDERFPLRELDGLNIWCQARLMEEGIEDMQNLSTANLVDLMLNTRMPIGRLADWVDQSFLYLRVPAEDPTGRCDRRKLRIYGIRTATDLIDACEAGSRHDPKFHETLLRLLNTDRDGNDDGGPSVVEGLRRSLEGEVNLWHVREWKKHKWLRSRRAPVEGREQNGNDEAGRQLEGRTDVHA